MKKTSILNGDEIKAVMADLRVLMPGLAEVADRMGHDLEAGARLRSLRAKCTEAREKKGLTIKDVAQQLKVPQYGIKDIEEVHLNGDDVHRLPGVLNISIAYVEGESLIMSLKDLAVSSGSACTSASLEPSYVLRALGLSDELAHSSLRFSFGRFTTEDNVDAAVAQLRTAVEKLRELSPLWDMYQDGVDLRSIEWAAH